MLTSVPKARVSMRAPCALVVAHARCFADWNLTARWINKIPNEQAKDKLLALLNDTQKIQADIRSKIVTAPREVGKIDFNLWRKRILSTQVVDAHEKRAKNFKVPKFTELSKPRMDKYVNSMNEKINEMRTGLKPLVEEARAQVAADIASVQKQKAEFKYVTVPEFLEANPELEKQWREKYDANFKSMYE